MDYMEPLSLDGSQVYEDRKTRFDVNLETPTNYAPAMPEIYFGDTQTPQKKQGKNWCSWLWVLILLIGLFDRKK